MPAIDNLNMVELFDPANPTEPRLELAANFDPHRHVRWEHRPALAEVDFGTVPSREEGKPLLNEQQLAAIRGAGITNLRSVYVVGPDGLRKLVGKQEAEDLLAWVGARSAAPFARAEAERMAPPAPPEPEGEEVTTVTTTTPPEVTEEPLAATAQPAPKPEKKPGRGGGTGASEG